VTPEPEEQSMRSTTAPANFTIGARAFDSEERAQKLGPLVGAFIRELSRQFDLSRLDGVTVAHHYARRCVTLPALPSLSQARSMSAMCRMADACVKIPCGSSRAMSRHSLPAGSGTKWPAPARCPDVAAGPAGCDRSKPHWRQRPGTSPRRHDRRQ
jgi:hypothetical protein